MSAPLAIVHTESSLGWGGQELRILAEARGLAQRGHELTLLCPPQARIYAEAPGWGLRVIALPIEKKRLRGLRALRAWFGDHRCDVVATHSSTDSWLAALALASLGARTPIVRTRHISAPVPRNALSRWLYRRAACIVTAGEALRQELVERNRLPPERIVSVPTGADGEVFRPGDRAAARRALGLPPERLLVGIVATLRSWKGHRYLLDAIAGLPQITLAVVGDGPQRAALEARAKELAIQGRVVFAGNQGDVVPWLQALDIFALPSYANEGVPQALLQAMLVALPCVTTDVGSIRELAADDVTALVVGPKDAAALRRALERLCRDPELRQRLGEAARRHCSARFSYQGMLDRMEALYAQAARAYLER